MTTFRLNLDLESGSADRRVASAWFADHFGTALPLGLREPAAVMSWESFVATYAGTDGPVRLGHWACTEVARPGGWLGPQARHFRATIAIGDQISTSTATAGGPIAALTAMLHDRAIMVETVKFHQMRSCGRTATFICGTNGFRVAWAMGWANDPTQSALRGLITCANRLIA